MSDVQHEWQPMETAPRNGEDILVCWYDADNMAVVYWDESLSEPYRWSVVDSDTRYHRDAFGAWMPLPEPPRIICKDRAADEWEVQWFPGIIHAAPEERASDGNPTGGDGEAGSVAKP